MAGKEFEFLGDTGEVVETTEELALQIRQFPPTWDDTEVEEAEAVIDEIQDYYPDYTIPGVEVTDTDGNSKYHGRDPIVLMEINPGRKLEALAHELGHDVEDQFFELDGSVLELATLGELFADLNALYFTDIEPDNRALERDPSADTSAYKGVSSIFEPEFRNAELEMLENVGTAANRGDWEIAQTEARKMVETPPAPTDDVQELALHEDPSERRKAYQNRLVGSEIRHNMFFQNLFYDEDLEQAPIDVMNQYKHDVFRIAEVLANQELGDLHIPIDHARYTDSRLGKRILHTSKAEFGDPDHWINHPEEVLQEVLIEETSHAHRAIENVIHHIEEVDQPIPDYVLDEISGLRYGRDRDGNLYHEKIDFPHNVGGKLAEELYLDGTEPIDVLNNPERYLQTSSNRIRQELHNRL